jgi:hypothetical protein
MAAGDLNWPLSGDVSQWINPSWWLGSFGQQLGFININEVSSGDPRVERHVVEDVASYGRQLGWISEALEAVVGCVRDAGLTEKLTDDQRLALDRLDSLVERVRRVKDRQDRRSQPRGNDLEARIAHLENELRSLSAAGQTSRR